MEKVNGKSERSGASDDPKPRPSMSRAAVLCIAHRLVDGLAGMNPVVYFRLNQTGDIPALAEQLVWWLEKQDVEIKE